MIIIYLRSSSYNNWDYCQHQYFLTYVLGWTYPAGKKAEKGTIVHKVMEVLASIKKNIQEGNSNHVIDENLGTIYYDESTLLEPHYLDAEEILAINKKRVNKDVYKTPCNIEPGHVRYGTELVESILDKAWAYYKKKSVHKWFPIDKEDCRNWVWIALDYANGTYDPRKKNIIVPEQRFDIEIDRPWAKYDYLMPSGERLVGNLAIKGTIDLITEADENILEGIDWKTGQRLDWATGTVKSYDKLLSDPQLMLYHYALRQLYPNYEHIMMSIFFVRDGGPFSILFEPHHFDEMENLLKKRFLEIRDNELPKLLDPRHKDFRCKHLCPFFKNKFKKSDKKNMCLTAHESIKAHGMEHTIETMSNPNHTIGEYHAPG